MCKRSTVSYFLLPAFSKISLRGPFSPPENPHAVIVAGFNDLLGRLSIVIKFPVLPRVLIRRVKYRLFEELIVHLSVSPE